MAQSRRPTPPPPSSGRSRFEDISRGPLQALSRVPRSLILLLILALGVAGLLLKGVPGALCLAILGLFLLWLIALSWPILPGRDRLLRVIVLVLVFGAAYIKAFGPG